jgi:penicillin-binding protein 1A
MPLPISTLMTDPLQTGDHTDPPDTRKPGRSRHAGKQKRRQPGLARFGARLMGGMLAIAALGGIIVAAAGYTAYRYYSADLPSVDGLRNYEPPVMTRVFANSGQLVADFAAERRIFVPYSAIPEVVKQAFLSAEDQNYWSNPGIDPLAIMRAGAYDLTHMHEGRRPIGASTITQQVAKNMLLDNEVSLARKIREAILAMRIDQALPKQRVLEIYLNEIYLGLHTYGVAAAAQAYFNKPLDKITLPEAAFLAALPKAPNNYNPWRYPDAAKARRDWVLDRMVEDHDITVAQATGAKAQPVVPAEYHRPKPVPGADWFAEEVRRELIARFGADATTQGGLMVRTSLDPALQAVAEHAVQNGLISYDHQHGGWRGPVSHLGLGDALAHEWASSLAGVSAPAGILPPWRLAVVLQVSPTDAKVGWLEPPTESIPGQTNPGRPRTGTMLFSDTRWARPGQNGKLGAAPRQMSDVVKPGDVVMIEPAAAEAEPGTGGKLSAAPTDRVVLCQVPLVQGALVSLEPATGRVAAMVGGWRFDASQFNRATQAQRQPGSSFKPFVYLTALEKGVSPSQQFLDAPIVIDQGPLGRWRPNNFEMDFRGPTPLRIALEQSINLVTLRVAAYIGMNAVADTAIAFHMVDKMPRVLPAAIGAVDTTPMREATAYASIDAQGREVTPSLIDSVQDRDGHVIWQPTGVSCDNCGDPTNPPQLVDDRKQIADPASVYQLINMMEGVVRRGTGIPAGAGINRPLAGKTGTSQDFQDAWFSGFSPDLVTVVWVGFDNPSSLGDNETGAQVAAPIWHEYMTYALKDRPVLQFPQPPGVTLGRWDTGSGVVTDAFKPGQTPGASDSLVAGMDYARSATAAATSDAGNGGASRPVSGGVDSSMGGLY